MTIDRTFTNGDDSFVVDATGTYSLNFLGGNDRLTIRAGTVIAYMGSGNDRLRIDGGYGNFWGQSGDDRFNIYSSGNHVDGGAGNDTFEIGASSNVLSGRDGDDIFRFTRNTNHVVLQGGDGNDTFNGNSHSIGGTIYGGAGDDSFLMFGNHGGLTVSLRGGAGDDLYRLDAHSPASVIEAAGDGTDTIEVANGVTYTLGDNIENLIVSNFATVADETHLTGNNLANQIRGGGGVDYISGDGGNDVIQGLGGNDGISGGLGDDRIYGGGGVDLLQGDVGNDTFVFVAPSDAPADPTWNNVDWIYDFESGDRIDVSAIDANSEVAGVQHFNVVEGEGHTPGTLYYHGDPAGWGWILVEAYIDGDDQPDMTFVMTAPNNWGYPDVTNDSFIVG